MAGQTQFGRRRPGWTPAQPVLVRQADPQALSPEAEAFRQELRSGAHRRDDFSDWQRAQQGRRILFWAISLFLMAPGLICFALDAPPYVSAGVEIGGIALGWWLRRERKRYLKQVATWEDPADRLT